MYRWVFAFAIPIVLGYQMVALFFPANGRRNSSVRLLTLSAGVGAGIGLTSIVHFLLLVALIPLSALPIIECGVLGAFLVARFFFFSRRNSTCDAKKWNWGAVNPGILALFLFAFSLALVEFWIVSVLEPLGGWDAFAHWNLKALFLYRNPSHWTQIFQLEAFHAPDYPLLLSSSVARIWRYWGADDEKASQVLGLLFFLSSVGTLVAAASFFRSSREGWLAGSVLCAVSFFPCSAAVQLADVPIGLFLLCGIVFQAIGSSSQRVDARSFLLSGFFISLAVWTKNEGWLMLYSIFLAQICVASLSVERFESLIELGAFVVGAMPVLLLAAVYHRYALIMSESPLPMGVLEQWIKSLDPSRWWMAISMCLTTPSPVNGLVLPTFLVFLLLRGRRFVSQERPIIRTIGLTLTLIAFGFLFVYVNSDHDLQTYIEGTWPRLVLQLVPSFIFWGFLISTNPTPFVLPPSDEATLPSGPELALSSNLTQTLGD